MVSLIFIFQDRATFHRLIVKNNAKKRKMYEAFIECVPLLKSLEVCIRNRTTAQTSELLNRWIFILMVSPFSFSCHKLSERMKIVDVLGARGFKDEDRIITQVQCWDISCW